MSEKGENLKTSGLRDTADKMSGHSHPWVALGAFCIIALIWVKNSILPHVITAFTSVFLVLLFIYFELGLRFNPPNMNMESLSGIRGDVDALYVEKTRIEGELEAEIAALRTHLEGQVDGFWIPFHFSFNELQDGVDFEIPMRGSADSTAKMYVRSNERVAEILRDFMWMKINGKNAYQEIDRYLNQSQPEVIEASLFRHDSNRQRFTLEIGRGDRRQRFEDKSAFRRQLEKLNINPDDPLTTSVSVLIIVERAVLSVPKGNFDGPDD